ncbi:MAG: hypothetical protein ACR2P6_06040, partial [Gammaproteobacteria bacterium]
KDYGVVIKDGAVDTGATEKLREKMRSERADIETFNFGPSIEEVRASCKEQTGLDAPEQPIFR